MGRDQQTGGKSSLLGCCIPRVLSYQNTIEIEMVGSVGLYTSLAFDAPFLVFFGVMRLQLSARQIGSSHVKEPDNEPSSYIIKRLEITGERQHKDISEAEGHEGFSPPLPKDFKQPPVFFFWSPCSFLTGKPVSNQGPLFSTYF